MVLSKKAKDIYLVGKGFSSEANGVFLLMDTELPSSHKVILNTAINEMVADGNFAELEQLIVVLDTSANSLVDFIGTQNFLAVASPTFLANRHWELNGTTQYLNSQRSPAQNVKATQDSAEYGAWVVNHVIDGSTENLLGERTTAARTTEIISQATQIAARAHAGSNTIDTVENTFASNSLYVARRPDSANQALFKNGVQVVSSAIASTVKGTGSIFVGARNPADRFFGGKIAAYYTGSGAINTLSLYNTLNTMITAITAL